ncbi:hypothetical protein I7I48_03220 [Histoplasma ohiense]|nr:hypothetical protein I7I48_03220 [Histoplasma ohiense (nom. inval.)]
MPHASHTCQSDMDKGPRNPKNEKKKVNIFLTSDGIGEKMCVRIKGGKERISQGRLVPSQWNHDHGEVSGLDEVVTLE